MSVEQLEQSVMQLSEAERRQFAQWFYEHEDELAGPEDIHPTAQAEILRRRDEVVAHPELLEAVTAEWFETLKRKLADARAAQTSAR
jgi:hypothetical protein